MPAKHRLASDCASDSEPGETHGDYFSFDGFVCTFQAKLIYKQENLRTTTIKELTGFFYWFPRCESSLVKLNFGLIHC